MLGRIGKACLVGILVGQLLTTSCVSIPTIKQPAYAPFLAGKPISEETLEDIKQRSPKDAVFAELLQAFALMRTADLNNAAVRKNIFGLLATSVNSFEDMTDPVNFSKAFSADESKNFRGRPHERMFASTMAAVFLMADNKCGQALPYLRNAEFLDARFQKMPFGTDAPLIYALMYRCLIQENASSADVARAADGVFRSVRFLSMQAPLVDALVRMADADPRAMAITNRLAYMIYEISIYYSLMTAPDHFSPAAIVDDAAKNASIFISTLHTNFEDDYKTRMKPMIDELAKVYGMDNKAGRKHLEELTFDRVGVAANHIAHKLKEVLQRDARIKKDVHASVTETKVLSEQILHAARSDKMLLTFTGHGPTLVREGSYDEISVIKPSKDANPQAAIRERSMRLSTKCGFHRMADGDFSLVLCKPGVSASATVATMPNVELLSLSRKATTAQGRHFDKVLQGRAQFRAATENIAEISAWSAFFLFYLGAAMMSDCSRRNEGQACYAKGLALWGIAGITVIFSGTVWLIGRSKNPAADSRFIHLMYESGWLAI